MLGVAHGGRSSVPGQRPQLQGVCVGRRMNEVFGMVVPWGSNWYQERPQERRQERLPFGPKSAEGRCWRDGQCDGDGKYSAVSDKQLAARPNAVPFPA